MRGICGQSPPRGEGVEGHGVSDQPFDPRSIDLVALVKVYSSPCSPLKAGIEEALGIFQRSSLGEGELHVSLEGAGHADEAVGFPDGSAPLPCFREVRACSEDDFAKSRKGRGAPVAKFADVHRDQQGRIRLATWRGLLHWMLLQIDDTHVAKSRRGSPSPRRRSLWTNSTWRICVCSS